jgi:DNA-directed RNA polymerase subunit RPC12/RpoP
MVWTKQPTRCSTCGRENLPPEEFPRSTKGYIYGECLSCSAARVARYRQEMAADPVALARHRKKERERLKRYRLLHSTGRPRGRPRKERTQ